MDGDCSLPSSPEAVLSVRSGRSGGGRGTKRRREEVVQQSVLLMLVLMMKVFNPLIWR